MHDGVLFVSFTVSFLTLPEIEETGVVRNSYLTSNFRFQPIKAMNNFGIKLN